MEGAAPGGLDLQPGEMFTQRLESVCVGYYRRMEAEAGKLGEKDF